MKPSTDPPRLIEAPGTSDPLRLALSSARRDLPSPAQLDRLAARLAPQLGGPDGGGPDGSGGHAGPDGSSPGAPGPAGEASGAAGLAKGAGSTAASALAGASLLRSTLGPALIGAAVVASGLAVRELAQPSAPASWPAASASALVKKPVVLVASAPTEAPAAASAPARLASPAPAAMAPSTGRASPAAVEPAPSAAEPAAPSASAPAANGETDTQLLHRASDALGSSPARALALTEEHERRFPGSPMVQEREAIAIQALAASGRTAEARERAVRFAARFPGSAHLPRIDAIVRR